LNFCFQGLNGWAHLPFQPAEDIQSVVPMIFSLYTVGSYFNHSCTPNAVKVVNPFLGNLTAVQAQTKIKKGEEITLRFESY
jgi:hypothetical protein